jgi:hypothetical protein
MFERKALKIVAGTRAAANRRPEHFADAQVEEFDRSTGASAPRIFLCYLIASFSIVVLGMHTSHAQSADEPRLPAATATDQRAATLSTEGTNAIERGRYIALLGDCGGCHTSSKDNRLPVGGESRLRSDPFIRPISPRTPQPASGTGATQNSRRHFGTGRAVTARRYIRQCNTRITQKSAIGIFTTYGPTSGI